MKSSNNTIEKYFFLIQNLSSQTTTYTNLNKIATDYKVGKAFITKLRDKNHIIVDRNGYYNWNNKIKPTISIVNSAIKEMAIDQKEYMKLRKQKKQITMQFNEPKKRTRKSRKQQQQPEQHIEQLGLIRKFIKFIW